jgi:hypothetical protein
MEPPLDAAAVDGAHAVGALPELLALVFERLPRVEQCVTVGRLAREWRRWAVSTREQLRAVWSELLPGKRQLPRWCLAEALPQLSERQLAVAARRAAGCGDLQRLQWLRAQRPAFGWDELTCTWAASYGHLDVLRWLRAQDPPCPWDEGTCNSAVLGGHLDVLRWLRAQQPPCPWSEQACGYAALRGHLDVLRWLRAQEPPCPWNERTCMAAAFFGSLDVLRWLRGQDPPCPGDKALCRNVARGAGIRAWINAQPDAA